MTDIEKKRGIPSGIIKSRRWVREQPTVNVCPKCDAHDPEIWRLLQTVGSKYVLVCQRCKHHPKAVFSFSPKRGLPRALRKWNRAK